MVGISHASVLRTHLKRDRVHLSHLSIVCVCVCVRVEVQLLCVCVCVPLGHTLLTSGGSTWYALLRVRTALLERSKK